MAGRPGIVSIEPAKRISRWSSLAETGNCRVLGSNLYSYQVIGLGPSDDVVNCFKSLIDSNIISCEINECSILATCSSYVIGSSSIVFQCSNYVAKLYLVLPPSNPEDIALSLLSTTGIAPIPVTRLLLRDQVIGVIQERVHGEPLAELAKRELENYLGGEERIEIPPLAARLLAQVHKVLGTKQEECMLQLMPRVHWYLARLPAIVSERLKPLLIGLINSVEEVDTAITTCQLVHQDPHLYQFISTTSSIRILDFNGEPLRAPIAPHYEPAIRDLAVLIRSTTYIAAARLIEQLGNKIAERNQIVQKTIEWLNEAALEAIDTYLSYAEPEDPGKELSLLPALIAERLAYEAWYEHTYGTRMLHIALAPIINNELLPKVVTAMRH